MDRTAPEISSQQLLQAINSGGKVFQTVLSTLYRASYARLLRKATQMVRDRNLAEDLVQRAFERLVDRRHQYRGDVEPAGYLFSILRNLAHDHLRSQLREPAFEQARPDGEGGWLDHLDSISNRSFDEEPDEPERQLMRRQLRECLQQRQPELDKLPVAYQTVVHMIHADGLKPAEIAQIVGRSPGATRQLIYECSKRLQAILRPCYDMLPGGHSAG